MKLQDFVPLDSTAVITSRRSFFFVCSETISFSWRLMLDGALIQVAKLFHLVWKGLVPFLQPCLGLLAEQSYELDHFNRIASRK